MPVLVGFMSAGLVIGFSTFPFSRTSLVANHDKPGVGRQIEVELRNAVRQRDIRQRLTPCSRFLAELSRSTPDCVVNHWRRAAHHLHNLRIQKRQGLPFSLPDAIFDGTPP